MGGNLRIGTQQATEIDLNVYKRTQMVNKITKLLQDINHAFQNEYQQPIWDAELFESQEFLGGSSKSFFNLKEIPDTEFVKHKDLVGDIDVQCDKTLAPAIERFLKAQQNKQIGECTFLGFTQGSEQLNGLFQYPDFNIQIDFEFGQYVNNRPVAWYSFSHSSEWADLSLGIKGVFHKWLYRALTSAHSSVKHQVDVLKTKINVKNNVFDNDMSFAVSSKQGGGLTFKYEPYEWKPDIDGIPFMRLIPSKERVYIQDLDQQFFYYFGQKPTAKEKVLQKSFVGTLELMNRYLTADQRNEVYTGFLNLCFGIGEGQMITRDDPIRDRKLKFAAIDVFVNKCSTNRASAVTLADAYEKDYFEVTAFKNANPFEKQPRAAMKNLKEQTPVVQSKRKSVVHLEKLKNVDFLNLVDQLKIDDQYYLNNLPITVKIDGMGGRFGKDAKGRPFYESSSSGPIQRSNAFSEFAKEKGLTDPVQLERAAKYDTLYEQAMELIPLIDKMYGADFLKNVKVHCEVLYVPMATQISDKIKFVNVEYNKFPDGVTLALVPLFIEESATGVAHPLNDVIKQKLVRLGVVGNTMFIDNTLTYRQQINVTKCITPLGDINVLRTMLSSRKRDQKIAADTIINPVKDALAKEINRTPNILGKYNLGPEYEGVILYSAKGPVKVTSTHFKGIMARKITMPATRRPKDGRSCVVTGGSFVGHKGHMLLIDTVFKVAKEQNRDPYIYISSTVGKDDPITPELKLATWQKLYPEHADCFQLVDPKGTIMKKLEKELVFANGYKDVLLIVGKDRAESFDKWANLLRNRLNNANYPENQDVVVTVKPRQEFSESDEGIRFTDLRNVLKTTTITEKQKLDIWCHGFDEQKLGTAWIKILMEATKNYVEVPREVIQRTG